MGSVGRSGAVAVALGYGSMTRSLRPDVRNQPVNLPAAEEIRNLPPAKRTMYRIPETVVQRILRRCANPAA